MPHSLIRIFQSDDAYKIMVSIENSFKHFIEEILKNPEKAHEKQHIKDKVTHEVAVCVFEQVSKNKRIKPTRGSVIDSSIIEVESMRKGSIQYPTKNGKTCGIINDSKVNEFISSFKKNNSKSEIKMPPKYDRKGAVVKFYDNIDFDWLIELLKKCHIEGHDKWNITHSEILSYIKSKDINTNVKVFLREERVLDRDTGSVVSWQDRCAATENFENDIVFMLYKTIEDGRRGNKKAFESWDNKSVYIPVIKYRKDLELYNDRGRRKNI